MEASGTAELVSRRGDREVDDRVVGRRGGRLVAHGVVGIVPGLCVGGDRRIAAGGQRNRRASGEELTQSVVCGPAVDVE